MPAPRKYPQELRERAMRLVAEARKEDPELSLNAAVVRIGQRAGVNRRIFSRFGDAPAGPVPLVLEQNLRNTRQISESFTIMAPNRLVPSTYDGDPVRFIPCSGDDAVSRADDVVEELLDAGWQSSDLALLTTQSRHPEHLNRDAYGGKVAYWDSFWDTDQVFYGTVLGFKGLERPAIVLAINEHQDIERARERLDVGLPRPRDLLVVVGDPAHIGEFGGADVLRHLRGEWSAVRRIDSPQLHDQIAGVVVGIVR